MVADDPRFEIVTERVGGQDLPVFANRLRSLREGAGLAHGRGDAVFLVNGDQRVSFSEFVERANSVSVGLSDAGVRRGDRVAVLAQNSPEWCYAFWGTVDIGAICVGLNGWWKTGEILHGLIDSGSTALIADGARFERISSDLASVPDLRTVFLTDVDPDAFREVVDERISLRPFGDLLEDPSPVLPTATIGEDEAAVIFYTSGTTGRPKGAISTHRNMLATLQNSAYLAAMGGMSRGERTSEAEGTARERGPRVALFTNPLFHVSGCHLTLVAGLLAGMRLVMPEGRFDPAQVLRLIEAERITMWSGVPTMLWRVCQHPDRDRYDTTSVVSIGTGGSPSGPELQRQLAEAFPNLRSSSNGYGMTEAGGITINGGDDMVRKPGSVGRPLPTVEVRIVGEGNRVMPPGQPGEVCARGAQIMPGYWNNPDATAEMIQDGWLHTGDVGYLDEDGYLFITDRAKDMIIRGGENVYCAEIEECLLEHPGVLDAAIIGVPHATLGEEVKAVVQIDPAATLSESDIQEWVSARLAGFKVPAYVEFRTEDLPRNAGGKLIKDVLRGTGDSVFAETM